MKKIIEKNNKIITITSNMKKIPFKYFDDFSNKKQKEILENFDYLSEETVKNNLYIDEYTSVDSILLLNSAWPKTDDVIEDELNNIFNRDRCSNFTFGSVQNGYTRDYYAVDYSIEFYNKINIKFNNIGE